MTCCSGACTTSAPRVPWITSRPHHDVRYVTRRLGAYSTLQKVLLVWCSVPSVTVQPPWSPLPWDVSSLAEIIKNAAKLEVKRKRVAQLAEEYQTRPEDQPAEGLWSWSPWRVQSMSTPHCLCLRRGGGGWEHLSLGHSGRVMQAHAHTDTHSCAVVSAYQCLWGHASACSGTPNKEGPVWHIFL